MLYPLDINEYRKTYFVYGYIKNALRLVPSNTVEFAKAISRDVEAGCILIASGAFRYVSVFPLLTI